MTRRVEVAVAFVRLGLTAFGGPAVHIALMEEEFVRRRRWISRERFLEVLGASSLIPGPTSTELAMHIGLNRAGWAGLLVAGVAFIAPAAVLVGVLAAIYVRFGELPAFEGVLRAVKPVVVVVVLVALVGLARTAIRSVPMAMLAVAAAVLVLAGMNEVPALLLVGLANVLVARRGAASVAVMTMGAAVTLVAAGGTGVTLPSLFAYFVRAGSVIFGSGYVLFAVLRGDLVERYRWLTEAQLLDAIAVGQVTPGPVFTSATFIGYLLGGPAGAVAATIGIFLPAFAFTALSARLLSRLHDSAIARAFLDGVSAAAVALIGVVLLALGRAAITDVTTAGIAVVAAVVILWLRWNSAWVIAGAAVLGLVLSR